MRITLELVLASARAVAKREGWRELKGGLLLTGTSDAGGVHARFELQLEADGRYIFEMDGRLARTLTFDGRDLSVRDRSGPTLVLELGERENAHIAQWIHSGYWLEPSCPIEIEVVEEAVSEVTLRLSFPESPASAFLVLDRRSWLPRELRQTSIGGQTTLLFQSYQSVAGIPIARLVQNHTLGETWALRVLEAHPASEGFETRLELGVPTPSDVHFDPQGAPQVELKRLPSGHLLVHPLVDGRDVGWFLLDSGAGQICIDPQVADELGLERFGSLPAVGVAQSVRSCYRQGTSLELGPLRLDDPVYIQIDLSALEPAFGVAVGGICGYEVFARAVFDLNLEQSSLSLFDPSTFELALDSWTRLTLDSRTPCIPCRFEGDREGLFRIDLGDTGSVSFYSPAVKSLALLEGREIEVAQVDGVGGVGQAARGTLDWFEIGGHRTDSLRVKFSQTEAGAFASTFALGNLGTHMLRPFRVVFDYSNSRIALLPRS